jgi:hypothetical protein
VSGAATRIDFKKAGGAAPNDVSKGGSSPCSPSAARGSGPRYAAFDTLPPAFATWQGCRTSPATCFNEGKGQGKNST